MRLALKNELAQSMYYEFIKLIVHERLGKDLGELMMSFLREDPKPWCWPIVPQPSPWDPRICVDPADGIELPLFAP